MFGYRMLVTVGAGLVLALPAGHSSAAFTPVLDEFWVLKNSSEIFRDSFDDGIAPPSGPDGANTYVVSGAGGMTSEAGGKLTMTPALGEPARITTTFADMVTSGVRRLGLDSASPSFLGFADAFEIHGLFDMSDLPATPGQSFGVRATDRAPAAPFNNEGDNTLYLFVGMSNITGEVSVFLRDLDFATNSTVVLGSDSIQSLLTGADQVELVLSKQADSDLIVSSYLIYDYALANPVIGSGSVGSGRIYDGEDYVRAQFATTDLIQIPEPAGLALVVLGLAAMAWRQCRRG